MIQLASDDNKRQFFRARRFLTYAALRDPEQTSFMPPAIPVTVDLHTLATYVGTYDFGASVSASNRQAPSPTYVGIGVDIAMQDGFLKVVAPYPNGPAFRAGVAAGDIITEVDDIRVGGLNLGQVQGRLRGPAGTPVHLRVMHPGQDNPVEVTAVREVRGPTLVGISGMEIGIQDVLRVRNSAPNGAAAKAGVMVGDIITQVDDTPIAGLTIAQIQAKLRGPEGTPVRLKIMHPGQESAVDVTLVRELIVGLGMEIAIEDDGRLKVLAPYPNWPAAKAGVMAGDIISHVDDTPINGLSYAEVQAKLRGPVGTSVRLKIVHPRQDSPVEVTVLRELIVGLGMQIAMQDGVLKVRAASPNGAAAKTGVIAGDIITHVDDTSIKGLNFIQAQDKLRGEVDTPVHLKIMHPGQDGSVEVTIVREMVRIPGAQITVRMDDGRLVIGSRGPWPVLDFDIGKTNAIHAISNREFYVDGGDHTRIAFISDHSGRITGAILNPGPREVKGVRVD
jgi:C-terminal processing protease CtpA/Prc